jgi:hypothetical protein
MTCSAITIWDADEISIAFTVLMNGVPRSIAGGQVVAMAQNAASGQIVSLTAAVLEAETGVLTVAIAEGSLSRGAWSLQARLTLEGETQTVVDVPLSVRRSL